MFTDALVIIFLLSLVFGSVALLDMVDQFQRKQNNIKKNR